MANKIKGKVPGINGEIEFEATGFATEESLRNLIKAITGSSTGPAREATRAAKASTKATNDAARAMEDFGDQIDLTTDEIERSTKNFSKNVDKVGGYLINSATSLGNAFENIASAGDEQSGKLSAMTRSFGDGLSSLTNTLDDIVEGIPLIGGAISAFTTDIAQGVIAAGSFAMSFVTGALEGFRDQQNRLFDSGVYFARGIDDAADVAGDAGTTIGYLAKTAENAGDSLRLFEGGTAKGLRTVAKTFKDFGTANQRLLYSMGYSQDEIMAGIADFGASMSQAGAKLTPEGLVQGSMQYLMNLKELSRLTGTSIKEQRDSQEANRRNLFVQNQLAGLSSKERGATEAFLNTVPKEMQAFALAGRAFDTDTGIIAQRLPTYAQGIADITQQLKTGAIDNIEATKRYEALMRDPAIAAEIQANQKLLGNAPAEIYGSLSGVINTIGQLQAQLSGNVQAASTAAEKFDTAATLKMIEENIADTNKHADSLNIAIGKYTDIEVTLSSQMQQASVAMTSAALDFAGGLAATLISIVDRLKGATGGTSAQDLLRDINTNMFSNSESFEKGSDPYAALTDEQLAKAKLKRTVIPGGDTFNGEYMVSTPDMVTYEKMKALGGPVAKGSDYLVGETGPEKFTPTESGTITPLKAVPVNINDQNMTSRLDSLIALNSAMLRAMERSNALTRQGQLLAS